MSSDEGSSDRPASIAASPSPDTTTSAGSFSRRSTDFGLDVAGGPMPPDMTIGAAPPPVAPVTIAQIGLACALEYLDFRRQYNWRPEFPALVAWLEAFNAAMPAFAASRPKD